jgi:hypothetical protein
MPDYRDYAIGWIAAVSLINSAASQKSLQFLPADLTVEIKRGLEADQNPA